jgi:ribosomal protein S27E/DNA-binding CsgD family transcriptional regulator
VELDWSRLTRNDKEILKLLYKNPQGMTHTEVSNTLKMNGKSAHNSLKRLRRKMYIEKVDKSPAFWFLNKSNKSRVIFYTVACPKCKTEVGVYSDQYTVSCKNLDCKSKSGKRTRFQITPKRIVGMPEFIL